MNILLLIAIVILLFYIKKKISDVTKNIEEKLEVVKQLATHPQETAAIVGSAVTDVALSKVQKALTSKKKK